MQLKKNWLESIKILQQGLKQFPNNIEILLFQAEIYFSRKLHRKAVGVYHRILKVDPQNQTAIFQLANAFMTFNEYKLAIDYYNRMSSISPEQLYNKAFAYSKIGRNDKSIQILKSIFNYQISSILPYIFLADLYFFEGQHQKSISTLENTEKKFGQRGDISYLKGLAYYNLNNVLKAYVEFTTAEKLNVRSANFYKNYALACDKIGKTEKAIKLLKEGIKKNPFDPIVYIELIQILIKHERYSEAYTVAELSKKSVPFSVTLSMLRDKIAMKLDDKKNRTE